MCALKWLVLLPILVLSACSTVQPGDFPPFAQPEAPPPPTVEAPAAESPVYVFEDGATTIRLMPGPCAEPWSIAFLAFADEANAGPKYLGRAKAIESVWIYRDGSTKSHKGCWLVLSAKEIGHSEDAFFLHFDDGERAVVPRSEFLKKPGNSGT